MSEQAAHVFNWGTNDRQLYLDLLAKQAEKESIRPTQAAISFLLWANRAYRLGRQAGDITEVYSPSDLLEAAQIALNYDVEG